MNVDNPLNRRKGEKSPHRFPSNLNFQFIAATSLFLLICILTYHHYSHNQTSFQHLQPSPQLPNEPSFLKTLQSCIPYEPKHQTKCLQITPAKFNPNQMRIAISSPPGTIGDAFHRLLLSTIPPSLSHRLYLQRETHVPNYGYGGDHGWTKIIRLVPTDLFTGSVDALPSKMNVDDVESVLRMIVRWHCRMSHVAAHTALMTVEVSEVLRDPEKTMRDVLEFTMYDPERHEEDKTTLEGLLNQKLEVDVSELRTVVIDAQSKRRSLFSLKTLEDALRDELEGTDYLREWPCRSFWDWKGIREGSAPYEIAKALVPDCDAEFVACNVMRDQCEAKGMIRGRLQGYNCEM